jgi:hypothetical protein
MRVALILALAGAAGAGCMSEPEVIEPGDPAFDRDPSLDVDNRSATGERRSHNMGLNCMRCHQQFGPGKGRFTIGLTVLGPRGLEPNPLLRLYDAPVDAGGKLVAELRGDALGNVFTTDPMPFPEAELFPVVQSEDGARRRAMPFPTGSGACNICHKPGFEVTLEAP